MKVCPACRTSYDDSQNFCLNDGTPLLTAETEPETETVIVSHNDINDFQPPQTSSQPSGQSAFKPTTPIVVPTGAAPPPPPPVRASAVPSARQHQPASQVRLMKRRSYTGLIFGLSALAALLLLGTAWWMFSETERDVSQTNSNRLTVPSPSATGGNANANVGSQANASRMTNVASSVPNQTANQSGGVVPNNPAAPSQPSERSATETGDPAAVAETASPSAPAPPVEQPQPPLSGRDAAKARGEAQGLLNGWIAALKSGDLNAHLGFYADSVDYYRGRYSRNQILADKQRAFRDYDDIEMRASNIRVTNLTATTATVLYDKEWRFANDAKINEGKVLSELKLTKIGDRWLITGERDLRVYYTRNA
jgi:hypothetical protein